MNEPLKFKLFSVYGQILHKNVLLSAFKRVKENDGCAGIDNVTIKEFDKHLDENIDSILSELKSKNLQAFTSKKEVYSKEEWEIKTPRYSYHQGQNSSAGFSNEA